MPPTPGACSKTQGFAWSPVSAELTREGPVTLEQGAGAELLLKSAYWLRSQHLEFASSQPGSQLLSRACGRMHSRPPWDGSCSQESPTHPDLSDLQTLPHPLWNLPAGVCLHSWDGVEDGWGGAALWVLRLWPNILRPTGASPG